MARKKNTQVYLAALLLLAGGIGYLIWSGLSQDSVYFLNVSEALAMEPGKLDAARLFGTVDETDLTRLADKPGVSFRLLDKDDQSRSITVRYEGAVPDTFKPGAEVIVEGRMDQTLQCFGAKTLMTKCPSKYQKENRGS